MDTNIHVNNLSLLSELLAFARSNKIDELMDLRIDSPQVVLDLQTLDLSYKELSCLPDALSCLTALKHLNLSHNKFVTFPQQVFTLRSLTSLDISWNHIMEIPKSFPPYLTINSAWNRSKSNR